MTEVWMTIVESGWNLWVWLVDVVKRRWVWLVDGICGCGYQEMGMLECIGVVSGWCYKEVYRFPHITYPYSTCISSFLQQHPYFFVHF